MKNFKELCKYLCISYKNEDYYIQALTHPSYENETKNKKGNYQRLEFVGDAVLELIVTRHIFFSYPEMDEGNLTLLRSALVREETLFEISKYFSLSDYILLGSGEIKAKGNERSSLVSDVFEAFIAAIYFDLGLDEAEKFVLNYVKKYIKDIGIDNIIDALKDPKTKLQEYYQVEKKSLRYDLLKVEGPSNKPTYTYAVYIDNILLGQGKGSSKQKAEQAAAADALKKKAKM